MVQISLSGSGEGPGRAIARGYSTRPLATSGRGGESAWGTPPGVSSPLEAVK